MNTDIFEGDEAYTAFVDNILDAMKQAEACLPKFEYRGHIHNIIDRIIPLVRDLKDFAPDREQEIEAAINALGATASPLIDDFLRKEEAAYAASQGG